MQFANCSLDWEFGSFRVWEPQEFFYSLAVFKIALRRAELPRDHGMIQSNFHRGSLLQRKNGTLSRAITRNGSWVSGLHCFLCGKMGLNLFRQNITFKIFRQFTQKQSNCLQSLRNHWNLPSLGSFGFEALFKFSDILSLMMPEIDYLGCA